MCMEMFFVFYYFLYFLKIMFFQYLSKNLILEKSVHFFLTDPGNLGQGAGMRVGSGGYENSAQDHETLPLGWKDGGVCLSQVLEEKGNPGTGRKGT